MRELRPLPRSGRSPTRSVASSSSRSDNATGLASWGIGLLLGFAALALAFRFQLSSGFDRFPGPRGDTRLIAALLEHWYQTLHGNDTLVSPPMFYPVKNTLGYSDLLVAFVPPYALLRALGMSIFSALEAVVIFFAFLNYVTCFWLLRSILRFGTIAAAVGALFFAFNDPKLAQPDHLQLDALFLMPIIVGLVIVIVRDSETMTERRTFLLAALAAIALDIQLATAFYVGWFLIAWGIVFALLGLLMPPIRRLLLGTVTKHVRAVMGAAAVFVLGGIPLALVYLPVVRSTGWQPYWQTLSYLPEPKSYLLMADDNYVWSSVTRALVSNADPELGRRVGVGLVASIVWLAASVGSVVIISRYVRRRFRPPIPSVLVLCLALLVLSVDVFVLVTLQYHGHSPWRFVYELVPGAKAVRAVARYVIILALPIAIVLAAGVSAGLRKLPLLPPRRRLVAATLLGVAVLFGIAEQFNGSGRRDSYSIRAENSHLRHLAARLPDGCSSFYLALAPNRPHPQDRLQYEHDAIFVALRRHVPTLNGRSGKYPPDWPLYHIRRRDYEQKVQEWISHRQIGGKKICRLAVSY